MFTSDRSQAASVGSPSDPLSAQFGYFVAITVSRPTAIIQSLKTRITLDHR